MHLAHPFELPGDEATAIGIEYAAIASLCFVAGVWAARPRRALRAGNQDARAFVPADRARFALFCLIGGWIFVYAMSPIERIPSIGAAVDKGGAIWILGVLLGLRRAFVVSDWRKIIFWTAALMVYPAMTLIMGGFLSYGSAAVIAACSVLLIVARSYGRVVISIGLASFLGISVFVNYFEHRDDIRDQVWGGASITQRLESVAPVFADFHWFSINNPQDLKSVDDRLNQNLFVGVAAERLHAGAVNYLYGESLWEGVLALIPRALWPDKPVKAGSGHLVADATGIHLSEGTSWGVGNVMEFYINFGMPGLIVGFLALGALLGRLDHSAAVAERRGDLEKTIGLFLPTLALIQPGGSMVEILGGAAAAYVASLAWKTAWRVWSRSIARRATEFVTTSHPDPRVGRIP